MRTFRSLTTVALALASCFLSHCSFILSPDLPRIRFGYLPPDLNITRRSIIPALTARQAEKKQMHELLALRSNLPASELVMLNHNNEMRLYHVSSDSKAMRRDYPRFARQVSYMKELLNSKPAACPKSSHPDFEFMNAAIYIRAKFRILDLPWGKAAVMLAQYAQEANPAPPNRDNLQIWIQGISSDALRGGDGFCISGLFHAKHPKLKPAAESYSELEGQNESQVMLQAERRLETFADDSFTPSLRDIERMLRELQFELPRS